MINPKNWKKPISTTAKLVMRWSIVLSAGAAALLTVNIPLKLIAPEFDYTLLPITKTICINIVVAGIVLAAMAKMTKATDEKVNDVQDGVDEINKKI